MSTQHLDPWVWLSNVYEELRAIGATCPPVGWGGHLSKDAAMTEAREQSGRLALLRQLESEQSWAKAGGI